MSCIKGTAVQEKKTLNYLIFMGINYLRTAFQNITHCDIDHTGYWEIGFRTTHLLVITRGENIHHPLVVGAYEH